MRIVFFTGEDFGTNELFLYMFAKVMGTFSDVHIVAVRRPHQSLIQRYAQKLKKRWRLRHLTSVTNTMGQVSSYPLRRYFVSRDDQEALMGLRALPRPQAEPDMASVRYVDSVNGPDAVAALRTLQPDVVIQFNAGILKRQVFEIARMGTLNLHPGIAPLIRGADPIYWALHDQKPEWLGATVHFIDEGIDSGPVLAYARVRARSQGERYPALWVRIYEAGVHRLIEVLRRLERGERWTIQPARGEGVYRSLMSGWQLARLELRGVRHRKQPRAF